MYWKHGRIERVRKNGPGDPGAAGVDSEVDRSRCCSERALKSEKRARLARGNVSEAALRSRNFLQASALLLSLLSLLRRGVNGDGNANRDGSLR